MNRLTRRIHYWATLFVTIPLLIVITSGILLQLKKQWNWVQPAEQKGTGSVPVVSFESMLESLRQCDGLDVDSWKDVQRIDVRPSKGLAKVALKSGWEVQIDLGDGRVLQQAIRRSDWIEAIHDGSYFGGEWTKLGVFLPNAIALLLMWITGLWMFWLPFSVKRKKKLRAANPRSETLASFGLGLFLASNIVTTPAWAQSDTACGTEFIPPSSATPQQQSVSVAVVPDKPNIVFILADDLGWGELGCYGQEKLLTPNIDRLANEGVRFTQHYSGAPVCAPSRCVLMTGKHLGHAEIRGNLQAKVHFPAFSEGQHPLSRNAHTMAEHLHAAGYATGAMGKWGLGPVGSTGDPQLHGFELFFGYNCQAVAHSYYPGHLWRNAERVPLNRQPIPGHAKLPEGPVDAARWIGDTYAPDRMMDEAEAFLTEHSRGPFFLYLPLIEPHVAMHPPKASVDRFPAEWDTKPYRGGNGYLPHPRPRAAYAAMIHQLDNHVGRILAALDRLALTEKTLVVFTSDNGTTHPGNNDPDFHIGGVDARFFDSTAGLRGYKGSVYEGGLRVPMLARWPSRIPAGSTCDFPSYFADWFPTLCDVANLSALDGMDGISLRPWMQGTSTDRSRPPMVWVFPEYGGQVAVRWDDNKLLRRGLATKKPGPWELYRLDSDREEQRNVAEEMPELVAEGRQALLSQMADNSIFPLTLPDE
jgi:arylsulfatase A